MVKLSYVFICLVFSTTYLAIKLGINAGIPPIYMAAIRFLIASVLVLGFLGLKKVAFPKRLREYGEIFLLGTLMTTLPFTALFWAEAQIPSGMAALLVATAPIFIGIINRMDRLQWGGAIIAVVGIYLVVAPQLADTHTSWQGTAAKAMIILAEIAFSYGAVRSKRLLAQGMSANMFNGLQSLFAALSMLFLSLIFEHPLQTHWTSVSILSELYLGIVASIIASGIYYWLVKMTNPLFPTTWTYVAPVIALIAGRLFLHETLGLASGFGAALILIGVLLINRQIFALGKKDLARKGSSA